MRIYITENYEDLSRRTANIISAQIIMKPECVLGLATGSSPIGAYRQLIASGEKKADALYQALYGPVTPQVPASILQLHNHVTVVADRAAAKNLPKNA